MKGDNQIKPSGILMARFLILHIKKRTSNHTPTIKKDASTFGTALKILAKESHTNGAISARASSPNTIPKTA